MVRPILLATSLLSLGIETYHVACVAYDAVDKAAYITEPFEQECSTEVACRRQATDGWLAFLKKEKFAQSPGAIVRCELYQEGSNPDESPRMRVRRWRDNDVATTQHANRGSYTRVVQTTFELK